MLQRRDLISWYAREIVEFYPIKWKVGTMIHSFKCERIIFANLYKFMNVGFQF